MSAAKHSPGPWHRDIARVGKDWLKGGLVEAVVSGDVVVAVCADDAANADLIAAAPALLAALVEAVNYIEHSTANRGKLSNAEQWDANVREFRATVGELSIGRTAVPCATVNLTAARAAIAAATVVRQ